MKPKTILEEILMYKREELPRQKRAVPAADLRARAALRPPPRDFIGALRRPVVQLIAEIKRASPSKGLLCPRFDAVELAETYVKHGAAAISVLTDARFFQGSLEHLIAVRDFLDQQPLPRNETPILRKDFVFDDYQLHEARAAGADAVLLIAAVLKDADLHRLLAVCASTGMAALIEVHDEAEVDRALALGAAIIGINNRDLRDFSVNLETTIRLRPRIPPEIPVVAESGIRSADDVARLADAGVDAILVGESIIRAKDRAAKLKELVRAGRGDKVTR